MCIAAEMGILRGRPFGGVMILLKHDLSTQTLCANERLVVVKLCNLLLGSVYFPCAGTADRELIIENICDQIDDWIEWYSECDCIIGGDYNTQLNDSSVQCSRLLSNFMAKNEIHLCDALFNLLNKPTYVNDSLGCSSSINHFLVSNICDVLSYDVLDPNINFSDHMPIVISYLCDKTGEVVNHIGEDSSSNDAQSNIRYLRWDYYTLISCHTTITLASTSVMFLKPS